ncbi:MAG: ATP-binding protein [Candidatus Limnocylindria bacterium]
MPRPRDVILTTQRIPDPRSLVEELQRKLSAAQEETKEALEQQTAVSEVLATISRSTFDLPTVLQTIAERAASLANADTAVISRLEGPDLVAVALHGSPLTHRLQIGHRIPVSGPTLSARAVRTLRPHYAEDIRIDPSLPQSGTLTRFAVPIQHDGQALGALVVAHAEAVPFTERQRALVATFADQAAIAIENVRLFNETKEALERQRATADILYTISTSPTTDQPVLEAVARNALRFCGAEDVLVLLVDGDMLERRAHAGTMRVADQQGGPINWVPLVRETVSGRATLESRTIHVPDIQSSDEFPVGRELGQSLGEHANLAAPLLQQGKAMGALLLRRTDLHPFGDDEVALAEGFAAQAVIAIENVRLFNEIREKSGQLEIANRELAAASRHKSEFLSNMSHELRTPLNAIIGFSDVLIGGMAGELERKQTEYLEDIRSSGRHLLSLINDNLDLSKVEAGRMELTLSEFSLRATLSNAVTMIRERAAGHGIGLDLSVQGIDVISADERKLKQILFNLLSNAVKFTPDGGTIRVIAAREGEDALLRVQDSGIGIVPEDQDRIFEEFRQVGSGTSQSSEGTGLGLTLTKAFVELHGGRIWFDSEAGKGSTFSLTIPLAPADVRKAPAAP